MKFFSPITYLIFSLLLVSNSVFSQRGTLISGKVLSADKEIIDFATAFLKGTNYIQATNKEGIYHIKAPSGEYTLVVSAMGYETVEVPVKLVSGQRLKQNVILTRKDTQLKEAVVVANGVSKMKNSPYNAVSIDTKALENTTQSLSDALNRAPGMKIRESGGVGSDMGIMMDGFSGSHVKIFIDGIPQEGVGKSFALNNIPVNFAERIEVYRGVVPVGFGADALGGIINIITKKKENGWFLDASYSYGSFNTHKSIINFGRTFRSGLSYEINAFQNYSDNNYRITTSGIREFGEGGIVVKDESKVERVKRFHDTYHNEAVSGKIGYVNKPWADRLMVGFTYSHMYKEIQTGVQQVIVYGGKYQKGYSLMPSLEYHKRDLFTKGLNVALTANYNKNVINNVDTSQYEFNWHGESKPLPSPGEQSYQHTRSYNDNWNGTFTTNYNVGEMHTFSFSHTINSFERNNKSLLHKNTSKNSISNESRKNIGGLSYRLMPNRHWNATLFGKYYHQFVAGPVAETTSSDSYIRNTKSVNSTGYGAAGTYYFLKRWQTKFSYEKAYRLPTETELFGDESLEEGSIDLVPESSHNINWNLSFSEKVGKHNFYLEGGAIYRYSKDYIYRNIAKGTQGNYSASYLNHGRVLTKGYNISARYSFAKWLSLGGNYNQMDVRDNVKTAMGTQQNSVLYRARMKNVPYRFANSDVNFYVHDFQGKGNLLTVTYDNLFMDSFPLFYEHLGEESKFVVPSQFSHNLTVTYSIMNGRYNFSFECLNFTDEKVYDNYLLQKPGRSFYGKFRVYLGN